MAEAKPEMPIGQSVGEPLSTGGIEPIAPPDKIPSLTPEMEQRQRDIMAALDEADNVTKQAGERKPFKDKDEEDLFRMIYALGKVSQKSGE